MTFYISYEGETERWYFEWLQAQINADRRTKNKVEFKYSKSTPSSFAKSNAGIFNKELLRNSSFCRVQDIEEYSKNYLDKFKDLLKSNKEAKALMRKYDFYIAYSNLTFEVWIIAHKMQVPALIDRSFYYREINKAYRTDFLDNADYKHEKNFKGLLNCLRLDDVINGAIPECARFKQANATDHPDKKRSLYGFDYYLNNPDTTLGEYVKIILRYAGYSV